MKAHKSKLMLSSVQLLDFSLVLVNIKFHPDSNITYFQGMVLGSLKKTTQIPRVYVLPVEMEGEHLGCLL